MKAKTALLFLFVLLLPLQSISLVLTQEEYLNGPAIQVPAGLLNPSRRGIRSDKDHRRGQFVGKYRNAKSKVLKRRNACIIKQASELYGIIPLAIIGSIIGEHTFNVDAWDIGQDNYAYMVARWVSRFENEGQSIQNLLREPQYSACLDSTDNNFDLWNCYDSVWKTDSRNGRRHRNNWELKWSFFNPLGSGYTYGFGQLGPVRALMVTDMVSQISGFEMLTVDDPPTLYDHLLNPEKSIHYVAATNKRSIQLYLEDANFDISQNAGIIATLYNLGREQAKADSLYSRTMEAIANGDDIPFPKENYYGWFVNHEAEELMRIYNENTQNCR